MDTYFNIHLKNPEFASRLDKYSLNLLNQKIVEIFNSNPNEILEYLSVLLNMRDFKLDHIYFGLLESDLFIRKYFEIEFDSVFKEYLNNPLEYYERIIQTFMLSSYFNTEEKVKTNVLNIIKSNLDKLDDKSIKRLERIIKTST